MARQTVCFTNVGASIVTNYRRSLDQASAGALDARIKDLEAKYSPSQLEATGHRAPGEELVAEIVEWARTTDLHRASAEYNSTDRIAQRCEQAGEPIVRLHLFATDTATGLIAARAVRVLLTEGLPVADASIERIGGLQVTSAHDFLRYGLPEYIARVYRLLDNAPPEAFSRIFNPTGGFKSVVPYLTMIAMLEGAQTQYLFEYSTELIDLQPLPIALDDALVQKALPLLVSAKDDDLTFSSSELEQALELEVPLHHSPHAALWESIDGQYFPGALGEIVLRRAARDPDPLVFSSAARRDFDRLDPDNRRIIVDALERMRYPALRHVSGHEKYEIRKTDCYVFGRSSAPRIFYIEHRTPDALELRVARIFPITRHEEKEDLINTGGIFLAKHGGWQPFEL